MPVSIGRDQVVEMVAAGAQLVEALPADEFDEEHLPGAINLPIRSLTADSAGVLDMARPVIVYCWDGLWDISPRAAWRLERFGFQTYDYTLGKADWLAAGQPTVRREPAPPRALDAFVAAVTCRPDEVVGDVAGRADDNGCVVTNEDGIVLGRLGPKELAAPPDLTAEAVMQPGPATVRADEPLDALLTRMEQHHVPVIVVSTPEGRLLGVVRAG